MSATNDEVLKQNKILENLNDRQLEAVTSTTGSTLVIAGAGSGKTAVLTRRGAYLIAQKTVPGEILCLTFTNKAATEMNHRLRSMLEDLEFRLAPQKPWITDYLGSPLLCTFHSLGLRLLREFGQKIDLKSTFTILDTDDQKKLVRDLIKNRNLDPKNIQPELVLYFIGICKQELLTATESRKLSKDFQDVFHQLYRDYENSLNQNQAVDFDDLILKPYLLLKEYPEIRQTLNNRWKHIMVDEFQDTNQAQFELVRFLAPEELLKQESDPRSLFVVGDDAQSIYSFRGSKIEIILNFEYEYKNTKTIILNQNYRSTQPILDLAEKIISINPAQKKKELFTENDDKMNVKYYLARNEQAEAEYILKQIHQTYSKTVTTSIDHSESDEISVIYDEPELLSSSTKIWSGAKNTSNDSFVTNMFDFYLEKDEHQSPYAGQKSLPQWNIPSYDWNKVEDLDKIVVLYRTHGQSRALEEVFLRYRLPYKLASGTRFLDRKEIKDVLAILKFIQNNDDTLSLKRFLPLVLDGVGPKTMDKIIASLQNDEVELPTKSASALHEVFSVIESASTNRSLIDFTKQILTETGYTKYMKNEYPLKDDYEARIENINELYGLMFPYDNDDFQNQPLKEKLQVFLEQVLLMSNLDNLNESEDKAKVTLMSLHQSKGLEFETVFLVGLEDGILPHVNSFDDYKGFEEEVRLAYVGVTRAKKYLHLSAAESRIQYGQIKANPVSRIFRPLLDKFAQRQR
jgi:DNA helicase II / ATP-dependent DNA helicase PcrA